MRWGFATWVSDAPTGGNVYDRRLIAELVAQGVDLHEHRVNGSWPRVSGVERNRLADLLTREPRWLIDAIVACGAPDVVTAALDAGPVVVLVHSFMSDEVWNSTEELRAYEEAERTILLAASGVICTSRWAADRVARRYGVPTRRLHDPEAIQRRSRRAQEPDRRAFSPWGRCARERTR